MRHALVGMAVQKHLFNVLQTSQHTFMQSPNTLVFLVHFQLGNAVGLAHTHALVGRQSA